MPDAAVPSATADKSPLSAGDAPRRPLPRALLKLARPQQWAKGLFVVIGPLYALTDDRSFSWWAVAAALLAFNLAASGCYVINDLRDVEQDRAHPRKRRRPIACGDVSPRQAGVFAGALFVASAALAALAGVLSNALASATLPDGAAPVAWWFRTLVPGAVLLYVANVTAYSLHLKRVVILDVVSLAAGFVLRVLGGCAAAGVEPSTWLINCTFFLSMFLAFGKRLGERRTMAVHGGDAPDANAGAGAASARSVQSRYTDDLLRMVVVMTAVATLVLYAGYVQTRDDHYKVGFNLLWLSILPATYALLRTILLVERGEYDDPTELAVHDRPFQAAVAVYGFLTVGAVVLVRFLHNQP
ncbi:MAG: UbiA prenyltransferase family protein [Phycisphaerales bacterium]|nr:UbiA prenyltransferase family protein [Phycisphaerales bacterium]